jgi:hypothetical protein
LVPWIDALRPGRKPTQSADNRDSNCCGEGVATVRRHHRRRVPAQQALLYVVPDHPDLPTGNVQLVPFDHEEARAAMGQLVADDTLPSHWVIRDVRGATVETVIGDRAQALRRMGVIAHRGAALPLSLHGPDGHATGDRLPG